ncbi:MAG TPA: UbiA family prenyltransferase [Methanocella sp.]|nr:UbiA family prenyltransferase [Methanocella sp.]
MSIPIESIAKGFKDELIYGAHFTAIVCPSLILVVSMLTDVNITITGIAIAYLIPLIIYTLNYNMEMDTDRITDLNRVLYILSRKKIFPYLLAIYLSILVLLILILFNFNFSIFVLFTLSGGLLYTSVFKILTKVIVGFKSIFISAVWAYTGAFFLLFYNSIRLEDYNLLIFVFIFLKIFINVVFFDIKDIESDAVKKLKTVPIILGKDHALAALHLINLIALVLLLAGVCTHLLPVFSLSLTIFYFYSAYYLIKGKTASGGSLLNYSYIMADAEFILWPIVLFIGKNASTILLH